MRNQWQQTQPGLGALQGMDVHGANWMMPGTNGARQAQMENSVTQMQPGFGANERQPVADMRQVQQVYQPQAGNTGAFYMPVTPQVAQHTGTQYKRRARAFHQEAEMAQDGGAAGGQMMQAVPGAQAARSERAASVLDALARLSGLQFAGRNVWLLLGAVVGSVWFAYMIVMLSRTVNVAGFDGGYELAVQQLRAGIGVFMQMPSILSGFVGMIFNWLAWVYGRRSLALTAAILYGSAVLLSFGQSLGYGAFMAVNLLGYFQMEKRRMKAAA